MFDAIIKAVANAFTGASTVMAVETSLKAPLHPPKGAVDAREQVDAMDDQFGMSFDPANPYFWVDSPFKIQ